jgi:hypothetical protein
MWLPFQLCTGPLQSLPFLKRASYAAAGRKRQEPASKDTPGSHLTAAHCPRLRWGCRPSCSLWAPPPRNPLDDRWPKRAMHTPSRPAGPRGIWTKLTRSFMAFRTPLRQSLHSGRPRCSLPAHWGGSCRSSAEQRVAQLLVALRIRALRVVLHCAARPVERRARALRQARRYSWHCAFRLCAWYCKEPNNPHLCTSAAAGSCTRLWCSGSASGRSARAAGAVCG